MSSRQEGRPDGAWPTAFARSFVVSVETLRVFVSERVDFRDLTAAQRSFHLYFSDLFRLRVVAKMV